MDISEKSNLKEVINSITSTMVFDVRDWSQVKRDAWIYGIIFGWENTWEDVAKKHNWSNDDLLRLKSYNRTIKEFLKS